MLNGGEGDVVMVEAVGPVVAESSAIPELLVEESRSDVLLEYPVYTKPAYRAGRDVCQGVAWAATATRRRFHRR